VEGNIPPSAEEDNDPLKWEKLFNPSVSTTTSNTMNGQTATSILDPSSPLKSDIRVVTFDLDNTIWKTSATLTDANDALSNHLKETFNIEERSEKWMGQHFKQFPDRYAGVDFAEGVSVEIDGGGSAPQDNNDYSDIIQNVGQTDIDLSTGTANDDDKDGDDIGVHIQASFDKKEGGQVKKKPVYLTLLRKDAIRSLIQEANNDDATTLDAASSVDLESQVDYAFDVWAEARCKSISQNFAPFAVETLTNLRSQLTSDTSEKVYIGAITDGNSNPDRVAELSGVFDFVIRAEDVGASKPDKRVYKAAVAALMLQLVQDGRSVEEFFLGKSIDEGTAMDTYMKSDYSTSTVPSWKDVEEEAVEAFSEAVGRWWVHIGDDFFKDVVAAKEFQMRTVWTRELIGGSGYSNDQKVNTVKEGNEPAKKQRSLTDLVNDVAKSDGVLKMTIGASEFLSNSLHEEFSDAILDRFGDLSGLLTQWHEEGKEAQTTNGVAPLTDSEGNLELDSAVISDTKDLEVSRPADTAAIGSEYQQPTEGSSDAAKSAPRKFCVFCGGQLPTVAKFCSSCGERQI